MTTQLRVAAVAIAVVAAALLLGSGIGTRLDFWTFRTGFTLLRWGAYLGIAAAVLALLALAITRPRGGQLALLLVAVVLGGASALIPWRWRQRASEVPPIHDITTDTENPPEFVAVLPLRADAPNPAEYGGPEIAAQQRAAYPDLAPLELDLPPTETFRRALDAARAMGWEIVAADSGAGRIEATATTRWFGFKDDVVVRIVPQGSGSRVDVRSVSRVGKSDVGANASRIRAYLRRLSER